MWNGRRRERRSRAQSAAGKMCWRLGKPGTLQRLRCLHSNNVVLIVPTLGVPTLGVPTLQVPTASDMMALLGKIARILGPTCATLLSSLSQFSWLVYALVYRIDSVCDVCSNNVVLKVPTLQVPTASDMMPLLGKRARILGSK